ncbi:MAG: MMPL family transporter, partial [Planctomycetota bacterium]
LFLLLPGAMNAWPLDRRLGSALLGGRWSPLAQHPGSGVWDVMTMWIGRRRGAIVVAATLLLGVMALGLSRITTSLNVVSLLDPRSGAIQDYNWFQENVAPLVPVEIVVRFEGDAWDPLRQAQLVSRVQYETSQVDLVDGALSAATFIPPVSQSGSAGATMQRALVRGALRRKMSRLVDAGYVRTDESGRSWRVSGRAVGRDDVDYGAFLDRIRERVDPVIAAANEQDGANATVSYTGVTSAVYEVQRALLNDLFVSFAAAVALVGAVMIVVLRSVRAGVAAMLPNVFPTVVLFGGMGWLGISIDVGSVMTASVALGIAVDGTFHFLGSFRRERLAGRKALNAIRLTYRHCGRALVQTAMICAAGMLPFVSSSFLPARSFACMLLLLLLVAAIGDLIVLPALLASPAGEWFVRGVDAKDESHPGEPAPSSTSNGVF